MSKPYGITAAVAVGIMAAVLTLALPVEAQVGAQVPVDAPAIKPAETVSLTMEQRHIIKEIIVKDMKIAAPQSQARLPTGVGETVPTAIGAHQALAFASRVSLRALRRFELGRQP